MKLCDNSEDDIENDSDNEMGTDTKTATDPNPNIDPGCPDTCSPDPDHELAPAPAPSPKPDPGLSLHEVFLTCREDLKTLSKEHEILLQRAKALNRKKDVNNDLDSEITNEIVNEVVVFGDVNLTPEERDLLKLGPGFMVVNVLSELDMRVESLATVTKMRWSRQGRGQEDLTLE